MSTDIFPEIPGFKIEKFLGGGRIADVYLGIQENPERRVVIKVLYPQLFRDGKFAERFLKSSKKTGKFEHPNIADIIEFGQCNINFYVVTEYLPESLRDKISRRFDLDEFPVDGEEDAVTEEKDNDTLLHILRQLAGALDYAHKEGMVHEEIRPENIRFREDGTPVVDFFISSVAGFKGVLQKRGKKIGIPHYVSPEQALRKPLDNKSDIYSLGVVFYEMLTGKVPYDADESIAIENQQIMEPVPRLPENFALYQSLLNRMMAKDKEERAGSGAELIRMIDDMGYKPPEDKGTKEIEPEIPPDSEAVEKEEKKREKKEKKEKTKIKEEEKVAKGIEKPEGPGIGRQLSEGIRIIKGIRKEDFVRSLLNPRLLVPVIGVVVVIGILLVLLVSPSSSPSPPPAESKVDVKATIEKKAESLTEEEKQEQQMKDALFQHRFRLAQRFFGNSEYRKAMDKLKEAEQIQQTAESKELGKKISAKLVEKKDDDTYKQALEAQTSSAVEEYIKRYPSGRHIEEAGIKLTQLKIEEKKQAKRRRQLLAASIKLRSQYKSLTGGEVKNMLKARGFFDKYYNKTGDFKNHFELKTAKGTEKVVIDIATALVWHQSGSPEYMSLEKGKQWIAELNEKKYAGYSDWRLPTIEEGASLMENTESKYGLFIHHVFSREQQYIWTGDMSGENKNWVLDFFGGDVNSVDQKYNVYVRPVRTLQPTDLF